MILATAGHIDHGKSTLVRALTGVDPDVLPEEKARGMTIDLGFAYLHGDGGLTGLIDVPGHDRFIRNMLAGVAAIDAALLVVAADDGVMPQTIEHVQILDLLGIREGVAVVTKADKVQAGRVREVSESIAALLRKTTLAGVPILPLSARTGAGIDHLRRHLATISRTHPGRWPDGRLFRFAIDRVFSRSGTGTIATGTVFDGRVRIGDRLLVSPAGREVRVRGLQIRGLPEPEARAGDRCALALAGVSVDEVGRGDWIVDPAGHAPTQRLEVKVRLLPTSPVPLPRITELHLHVGTVAMPARLVLSCADPLEPGASGLAHLIPSRPLLAAVADRFILRDATARRTVAGGIVLDPFAPRRRVAGDRRELLAALEAGKPADALRAMLALPRAIVPLARYRRLFNLTDARASELAGQCGAVGIGRADPVLVRAESLARWRTAVLERIDEFHRSAPRTAGMEEALLHRAVLPAWPANAFSSLLRELAANGSIALGNGLVSRKQHDTTANDQDDRLWRRIAPVLDAAGFRQPRQSELAAQLGVGESLLIGLLHRKSKMGKLVRIGADRYYPPETIHQLAVVAADLADSRPDGLFTAADFRDATRIGRMLGISILEYFDSAGITRRTGDARRLLRDPRMRPARVADGPARRRTVEPANA